MNKEIYEKIRHSTSLPEVRDGLVKVFEEVKHAEPDSQIGFVSGIISSDGPELVHENLQRLHEYTVGIRSETVFPVFSAVDVFDNGMYDQIDENEFEHELREQRFNEFWTNVLTSGHITDIFMTPRWEQSFGAKNELRIAQERGFTVHYIEQTRGIKSDE